MTLAALHHLIRSTRALAEDRVILVLGSASLLASFPDPGDPQGPLAATFDADLCPDPSDELTATMLDEALGENRAYCRIQGYHAAILRDSIFETLPSGWRERLMISTCLRAFLFALALLPAAGAADILENFDVGWDDPSYAGVSVYEHAGVGIWESGDALVSADRARSGRAVRFNQAGSPYLLFKGFDGNGIDGGVGTVSFWYRHWDGDGNPVSFALEYKIGGGNWIEAGAAAAISENYAEFTRTLNLTGDDILLRVRSTANSERLLIDDFSISTGGVGPGPGDPPVISFEGSGASAREGDGVVEIPVRISPAVSATVSVTVAGGSATAGSDFLLLTETLTFGAAETLRHVRVSLINDDVPEPVETLVLTLTDPVGAVLGAANFTLTIADDDHPAAPPIGSLTIMAANTSSGNFQSYQGPGERIFQALDPDIVGIQEFNVTGDLRAWVDRVFGEEFHYYIEPGNEQIPNGVISRYPIIAAGEWVDVEVSNRDFAWATIDIPGPTDLHVISVHFLTIGSTVRRAQAEEVVRRITGQFPENDYIVLAGDLNTDSRTEGAIHTLKAVFSDQYQPAGRTGNGNTNANRNKPYDWVLPNAALNGLHRTLTVGGIDFPAGIVFDTREWTAATIPPPALTGDSGVSGMQHMAVMKSFSLVVGTTLGTPFEWLESHGINENFDTRELLDPDGDGAATWEEYLANTDPHDPASVFRITSGEVGETGASIRFPTRPNRRYRVEFSDNLTGWQSFATASAGIHLESRPDGGEHTFTDDFSAATSGGPPTGGRRFYRVAATLP